MPSPFWIRCWKNIKCYFFFQNSVNIECPLHSGSDAEKTLKRYFLFQNSDDQGWAPAFISVQNVPFFSVLLKNATFFSVLFWVFGDLWDPKERKECNVLLQRTEKNPKNAMFFCKECKKTQRMQRSFAKNVKECKNVSFFCKRTQNIAFFFSIYIYRYI